MPAADYRTFIYLWFVIVKYACTPAISYCVIGMQRIYNYMLERGERKNNF